MVTEYLYCPDTLECKGTFAAWDERLAIIRDIIILSFASYNENRIMNQLVDAKRAHFPAVLTYKKACDRSVITMLRGRTLGNSSSALRNGILEIHSEEWLKKKLIYLSDCKAHRLL